MKAFLDNLPAEKLLTFKHSKKCVEHADKSCSFFSLVSSNEGQSLGDRVTQYLEKYLQGEYTI